MYTLIIDTSTERGIVALAQGINVLFTCPLPVGLQNSKSLLSTITHALDTLKISPSQLKVIGVGIGPGAYTGIRVGVATASGLALGLGVPLCGFSSLSGFVSEKEGLFASVIDAKMGGVYFLIQERKGTELIEHSMPALGSVAATESYATVVGPSFERLPLKNAAEKHPDSLHLAHLVEKKFQMQDYSLTGQVDILYLR